MTWPLVPDDTGHTNMDSFQQNRHGLLLMLAALGFSRSAFAIDLVVIAEDADMAALATAAHRWT